MNRYEISLWSDVYDDSLGRFVEKKEMVIGSDTMTSESRAREPKLVNNINGTNKFTFDLYYRYIDTRTGEEVENPYLPYLVNERKIKVLWKDEWYDLLIKQIKEDQVNHVFHYTCEDSYITELSRTGFELEFSTELENNIGTAQELISQVIDNTDWRLDPDAKTIYQLTEEPVYESTVLNNFIATKCPDNEETTLQRGAPLLVYYSYTPSINDLKNECQIYYAGEPFKQDQNEMLVINGNCYNVTVEWVTDENIATATLNGIAIFSINFAAGLSTQYRAERYVQSQKMVYNEILDRYVNVYTAADDPEKIIYGYTETEYNGPLSVVNLVTNPSNFKNLSGWTGEDLYFKIYPAFDKETIIREYTAISYFRMTPGHSYSNSGIQNNHAYIQNGFSVGENYIFRIRAIRDTGAGNPGYVPDPDNPPTYIQDAAVFSPTFSSTGAEHKTIFSLVDSYYDETKRWLEYKFTCINSCSYEDLLTAVTSCNINIDVNTVTTTGGALDCWIEEIQFFPEKMGGTEEQPERIDPNAITTQGVAQIVWRYMDAKQEAGTTKDDIKYLYTSVEPWDEVVPVTNNYERYGTIEEAQSNRFNILQSIAEKFECWIRFKINHDERGAIVYDSDGPQKFISIEREAGQETGIGFIYGVDLTGVTRDIKSNSISTKTIVSQNENEFGQYGFCSIARSEQNYPRENVIYNFDYYIQHGLLDRDTLYYDLYGTTGGDGPLKYYTTLHNLNTQYADNLEIIINKNNELTKQEATKTVYEQYLTASQDELNTIKESLMKLAGVETWIEANRYAYSHKKDTKVQSLMDDKVLVEQAITTYQNLKDELEISVQNLQELIDELNDVQDNIIEQLRELNRRFYIKYSRFIQEGTWSSEDYYNDDLYYLDAVQVAYTSSRPQISYEINVLRLSDIDEYSSKIFHLGDISFIQDVKYFGYLSDGITPYKEKVILTEITSCFDTPDKDTIKVQNYKTQFDDLFNRITAATQQLEFSEGKYTKAANIVQSDGTIKSSVIQNTFDSNKDLIYGAQNESVTMDNTGITVSDNGDASRLLKITSGGVFVSIDNGDSWKNAIRGDGINTDLLTAGRINTEQITVYNGEYPSFRWDASGINAYKFTNAGVDTTQFVRFDQYGIYGIKNAPEVYIPTDETQIYQDANFGLTWTKFFMKNNNGQTGDAYRSIEISTDNDIVVKQGENETTAIDRISIGRVEGPESDNYGMIVRNNKGDIVFQCDENGSYLSGWQLTKESLTSTLVNPNEPRISISANGTIGAYGNPSSTTSEVTYTIQVLHDFTAMDLNSNKTQEFKAGEQIYVFVSSIGSLTAEYQNDINYASRFNTPPSSVITPVIPSIISFAQQNGTNYQISNATASVTCDPSKTEHETIQPEEGYYHTTYHYKYDAVVYLNNNIIFTVSADTQATVMRDRYVPASDTTWYIDKEGSAIFHNIYADGGQIAGWWIDSDSIYQTYDGTKNKTYEVDEGTTTRGLLKAATRAKKTVNNVKTQLSSTGVKSGSFDYNIITDAVNAGIGTVGGLLMQGGLINGYNIASLSQRIDYAVSLANTANNNAATANRNATAAQNAVTALQNRYNGHTHSYTYYTCGAYTGQRTGTAVANHLHSLSYSGTSVKTGGPSK